MRIATYCNTNAKLQSTSLCIVRPACAEEALGSGSSSGFVGDLVLQVIFVHPFYHGVQVIIIIFSLKTELFPTNHPGPKSHKTPSLEGSKGSIEVA